MTICNFQCTSLLHSKVDGVQNEQDNQDDKEMKGHMQWLQLISDWRNVALETTAKILLIMRFMLPNFRIMQKNCSFRIFQNLKTTHADPDHIFLAIA